MNFTEIVDLEKLKEIFVYHPKYPLLFNSGTFLLLFMVFYGLYILLNNKSRIRIIYTVLFSIFFYYKSSGFYFWVLILSTVVDYGLGNLIYQSATKGRKKFFLVLSLISNLGLLAYFKYFNFFIGSANDIAGMQWGFEDIFLPVGISFYTFQTLSYSIDIYRGNLLPAKNIWDFGFFVSFFPQLVAGPIVRAADFIPQISEKVFLHKKDLSRAFLLICGGLFKKAVISDYISTNFVDRVFDNPLLYNGFENLAAVYGYALQIYCDFSGYSDMAIGLSLLLGFRLPDNFDSPYKSTSITEFWRRWHISLSSWLRDYLYISLGGNRKGKIRTYINLMLTMLIGGLWHGANWKFVMWGALHGAALALEKLMWTVWRPGKYKITRIFGGILTFHFVCFCWIYFRASSFDQAMLVIQQLASGFELAHAWEVITAYREVFWLLALGYVLHLMPAQIERFYENTFYRFPLAAKAFYLSLMIWIVMQVANADIQPFIYFQF